MDIHTWCGCSALQQLYESMIWGQIYAEQQVKHELGFQHDHVFSKCVLEHFRDTSKPYHTELGTIEQSRVRMNIDGIRYITRCLVSFDTLGGRWRWLGSEHRRPGLGVRNAWLHLAWACATNDRS